MKRTFAISILILTAACASKPKPANDIDWDYVFPSEEPAEYCEEEISNDCSYYPPYYYH